MIIAVLISLSALLVNGQFEQNGFRINRQLDLGLQDIERTPPTEQSKPQDLGTNDFVPPLSNAYLPAKFDSAQSQQSFESANVNGKQKELCKAPFDSTLCKGDADVEKPSQDLVPPFNSLEEGDEGKAKTATTKPQNEDAQTTVVPTTEQEPEVTTVKAPELAQTTAIAESSSAASSVATTTPMATEVITTEKVADKAEASYEQQKSVPSTGREYLPPVQEISAAAQTNIAVIQPLNQADNHDHHHHHDENFDLCADAFHSFLCAPLKTRRRITGALPDKFKGSNSFLQYQKVLPNFENQPASSNAVQNEYLPPKTNGFATDQIQTTYSSSTTKEPVYTTPPTTTVRPRFNSYTTSRPFSQYNTYTTSRPHSQFNTYTTSRPYSPFSQTSNTYDKTYIPPLTGSPASNPSFYAPISNQANQVFGSRIPTAPTASTIKTADNTFIPSSTFNSPQPTYKAVNPAFPGIPTYKPFSSNENRHYLPPADSKLPAASFASPVQNYYQSSTSSRPQTSAFGSTETNLPPKYNYVNQKPAPTYQPFSSFNTVTSPPAYQTFSSFNSATSSVRPTFISPFATSHKPFSQGVYSTSQPGSNFKNQASSNYASTTIKPFTTTKTSYNQAVTSQDKYYLPPDPKEPAAAQVSSSAVPAPQNSNPFHHGRDLCTDPFHSFLCTGPKTRKRITGALPSTFNGESTKTNEQRAAAPSNQNENIARPDKIPEAAPAQNFGYKYPTPLNPLPTPSPTLPPFSVSTGYSYPKPDKVFPFPSQQEENKITTKEPESSTLGTTSPKPVNGYEPQPDKTLPAEQSTQVSTTIAPTTGYSYQRPQKTFALPTEQKDVRQKPVESSTYRQSTTSLPGRGKGYQYSKPDQSFRLPEKKGYSYPKPEKRFELPTESRRKSLPSQTNPNLDPVRNLGSADFIPVNKVDFKRSRPTNILAAGLKRFGERLKVQDKRV